MSALPVGTITFLFTDIVGSTRLWEQHPDAMRPAMVRHDAIFESVVEEHHGYVVRPRGEGDSRFAVFDRATDAVAAAAAMQQALYAEAWPETTPLCVRMALHTGEADLRQGDYYGSYVNRCARLRSIGHGGQVLLSQTTRVLVESVLPPGVSLRDLGEHRLRDLPRPEHIFELVIAGLPGEFPPLCSLENRLHNLPVQLTPLIGRNKEVAAVVVLLKRPEMRLLTLTGPGGTGKTRLSLQVAGELLEEFEDGVFFVGLAPISDPALVISTIAQVLAVAEAPGRALLESLQEHLQRKQLLLVLDNFEQVVEAAPQVSQLLAACSHLKVLVSSRRILHLHDEREFPVPPLALPDLRRLPSVEALSQYAAVELFIQRALAVKPDFAVTNQNAAAVAEICARLDGLPLAIELAAARVKLLPPQAMLTRLESRLKLLTGGPRDLPARQQTLRAAIAWSYGLLSGSEQTLFKLLAIFVGGCTLEALDMVCAGSCDPGIDLLDELDSLINNSLLRQQEQASGEPRFVMLETIREYAGEQLQSAERTALEQRHAQYYLALAEQAQMELMGPRQKDWLERFEAEQDNFRAALTWTLENDATGALHLAAALSAFWETRGHYTEGRNWLEQALAHSAKGALDDDTHDATGLTQLLTPRGAATDVTMIGSISSAVSGAGKDDVLIRAQVLCAAGRMAYFESDFATARDRLEEGLALFRQKGDQSGIISAMSSLILVLSWQGEIAAAISTFQQGMAILRQMPERSRLLPILTNFGWATLFMSTPEILDDARTLNEEVVRLARAAGDQRSQGIGLDCLGQCFYWKDELVPARRVYEECLPLLRDIGENLMADHAIWGLGKVALLEGRLEEARACATRSLLFQKQHKSPIGVPYIIESFAHLAVVESQPQRAVRLFAAAAHLREHQRSFPQPLVVAENERYLAPLRETLSAEEFAGAWEEGSAMAMEEAIAYVLDESDSPA